MITNEITAGVHLFSIIKISRLTGTANPSAVKKESWRGEMFLVENMMRRYKVVVRFK